MGFELQYSAKQLNFVLLSGRWFASTKLDGPWSYVAGDKLPTNTS
jgi:hypothetical protein